MLVEKLWGDGLLLPRQQKLPVSLPLVTAPGPRLPAPPAQSKFLDKDPGRPNPDTDGCPDVRGSLPTLRS